MQVFNELVEGERFPGFSFGLGFMDHASSNDGSSPSDFFCCCVSFIGLAKTLAQGLFRR